MFNTTPEVQEERVLETAKAGKQPVPKKKKNKKGDLGSALLFLSPTLVIFSAFILFPVFFSFYLSFQKWNMFSGQSTFVGLDNYIRMFQSPEFWSVLRIPHTTP